MGTLRIANNKVNSGILGPLSEMFQNATAIRFSIAFVSEAGFQRIKRILDFSRMHNINSYGVIGIHHPTNIDTVNLLNDLTEGRIYIFKLYEKNIVENIHRHLLHTKLIVADYKNGIASIYIGSHNWTENALSGPNLESGIIVDCYKKDFIYKQICMHIEECRKLSGAFDKEQIALYKLIQKHLHENIGRPEKPKIDFTKDQSLIMLAEIEEYGLLDKDKTLYIEYDEGLSDYFQTDRKVIIYCYRKGSLFNHEMVHEYSIAGVLECQVTSSNRTQFHPSNADSFRPYDEPDFMIRNFNKPEIVPIIISEDNKPHCQGVIRVLKKSEEIYIHLEGASKPSFKIIEETEIQDNLDNEINEVQHDTRIEQITSASYEMEIKTPLVGLSKLHIDKLDKRSKDEDLEQNELIPKRICIINTKQKYLFLSQYKISVKRLTDLVKEYPLFIRKEN
ncbi:MAG: hypothetical protein V2B15_21325 [Bacteroidota bacterium]